MKTTTRPFAWTVDILRRAKLRPTCQRMGLVKLLFGCGHRHICAEELYKEARKNGINLSLATVYNTLNQFKEAGLLREILTGSDKAYFDTNLTPHFHLFCEEDGRVEDLPAEQITVCLSEDLLKNTAVKSVDVVVRI
ncbi:MAG: transcriptional repressor [Alphaproteobacteria bacterium]|nr:transcriptional repressor [Alphaproteobacteria bacterium]